MLAEAGFASKPPSRPASCQQRRYIVRTQRFSAHSTQAAIAIKDGGERHAIAWPAHALGQGLRCGGRQCCDRQPDRQDKRPADPRNDHADRCGSCHQRGQYSHFGATRRAPLSPEQHEAVCGCLPILRHRRAIAEPDG